MLVSAVLFSARVVVSALATAGIASSRIAEPGPAPSQPLLTRERQETPSD